MVNATAEAKRMHPVRTANESQIKWLSYPARKVAVGANVMHNVSDVLHFNNHAMM